MVKIFTFYIYSLSWKDTRFKLKLTENYSVYKEAEPFQIQISCNVLW